MDTKARMRIRQIMAGITTVGFFGILIILLTRGSDLSSGVATMVNILLGALAANFTSVVAFYFGSSEKVD